MTFKMPTPPPGCIWVVQHDVLNDGYDNYSDALRVRLGWYETNFVTKGIFKRVRKEQKRFYKLVSDRCVYLDSPTDPIEDQVIANARKMLDEHDRKVRVKEQRERASEIVGEYA